MKTFMRTEQLYVWAMTEAEGEVRYPYNRFNAFVWEKGKTMDFSETVVVYDLKLATDDRSVDIKTLSPGGCMPPAPGLYTCIK